MTFYCGKARVTIRFSLALLLCLLPILGGKLMPLAALCIALHEAGHLLFLAWRNTRLESAVLSISGVRIKTMDGQPLSAGAEIALNAAGPCVNLLSTAIICAAGWGIEWMRFAAVSLVIAVVSLLPIGNTDGAAILDALLHLILDDRAAGRILLLIRILSGVGVLLLLWALLPTSQWHWYYLLGLCGFIPALVEDRR